MTIIKNAPFPSSKAESRVIGLTQEARSIKWMNEAVAKMRILSLGTV